MSTADVKAQISATASAAGVPPSIALAVAQQESSFNQSARGAAGEIGVFQLMPGTAASLGVNPTDLTQNIQGGVNYLAQMYAQFGDWPTALAAYNAGPGNVSKGIIPASTQSYVSSILANAGDVSATTDAYSSYAPPVISTGTDTGVIDQADLADSISQDSIYAIAGIGVVLLLVWAVWR